MIRLDVYVGERDLYGIGFSDNVIFRKQYYVRAVFDDIANLKLRELVLHTGENFSDPAQAQKMRQGAGATSWEFDIGGTGFSATFGIGLTVIP